MSNYYSNNLCNQSDSTKYAITGNNVLPLYSKIDTSSTGCRSTNSVQQRQPIMTPIPPIGEQTPITLQSREYVAGFLRTQLGKKMRVEFLLGNGPLVDQTGELVGVGASYILLFSEDTGDTIMCDLYSIKFVTIYGQRVSG